MENSDRRSSVISNASSKQSQEPTATATTPQASIAPLGFDKSRVVNGFKELNLADSDKFRRLQYRLERGPMDLDDATTPALINYLEEMVALNVPTEEAPGIDQRLLDAVNNLVQSSLRPPSKDEEEMVQLTAKILAANLRIGMKKIDLDEYKVFGEVYPDIEFGDDDMSVAETVVPQKRHLLSKRVYRDLHLDQGLNQYHDHVKRQRTERSINLETSDLQDLQNHITELTTLYVSSQTDPGEGMSRFMRSAQMSRLVREGGDEEAVRAILGWTIQGLDDLTADLSIFAPEERAKNTDDGKHDLTDDHPDDLQVPLSQVQLQQGTDQITKDTLTDAWRQQVQAVPAAVSLTNGTGEDAITLAGDKTQGEEEATKDSKASKDPTQKPDQILLGSAPETSGGTNSRGRSSTRSGRRVTKALGSFFGDCFKGSG